MVKKAGGSKTFRMILLLISILMLLWGFIIGWIYVPVAVFAQNSEGSLFEVNQNSWGKSMMGDILPTATYLESVGEEASGNWLVSFVKTLTSLDFSRPSQLLAGELPAWESVPATAEPELFFEESPNPFGTEPKAEEGNEQESEKEEYIGDGTVLVGIYNSHTAESYATGTDGASMAGKRGGVYQVGKVLAQCLEEKGIGVVLSQNIHDYPDWSKSYANSLVTAKKLLEDYPTIKILVDVHRDANLEKDQVTTKINGKSAARIMLVVGSNVRATHPNWQQNKAFAEDLGAKINELYPNLLREVRVQNGRYNQHVMNHAILIEVGADQNTLEEALYSGELLADVLASVLQDLQ